MVVRFFLSQVVRFRVKPKVSSKSTHPIANARLLAAEKARNGSSRNAAQSLGPSTRKVCMADEWAEGNKLIRYYNKFFFSRSDLTSLLCTVYQY